MLGARGQAEAREAHSSGRLRCFVCGGLIQPHRELMLYRAERPPRIFGAHTHCWVVFTSIPSESERLAFATRLHDGYENTGDLMVAAYTGVASGRQTDCADCAQPVRNIAGSVVWVCRPRLVLHSGTCFLRTVISAEATAIRSMKHSPRSATWDSSLSLAFVSADRIRADHLEVLGEVDGLIRERVARLRRCAWSVRRRRLPRGLYTATRTVRPDSGASTTLGGGLFFRARCSRNGEDRGVARHLGPWYIKGTEAARHSRSENHGSARVWVRQDGTLHIVYGYAHRNGIFSGLNR